MKVHKVSNFKKGWFIGDFSPSLLPTREFETAVKFYKQGDHEAAHLHKVAREYTVIGAGKFQINGTEVGPGDIIEIPPGEVADFICLQEGVTFVVKSPSAPTDKHVVKK